METSIRPCRHEDGDRMLEIINLAALAYRGAIPADCWHDPYMPAAAFAAERARGVCFHGYAQDDRLIGVMAVEPVRNVSLVRHAYVHPDHQGRGIGSAMLSHILTRTHGQVLVGTWQAATWAIRLYERHGFVLPTPPMQQLLLSTYWCIPARMAECSVALAYPPLSDDDAVALMARADAAF
ncbi:GNAT family N-acetyltransferase [Altererythrobacter soli]|uniref:GNAT family N-acetyltransferase n=1 Tax=Croceibacterium soli TaxID=1739690 RepID=A0A6I4USL8_9SPHN|nr:GNAT family N-acetyltransferase [Croceibacterium soli]MXP40754.1 GNAT family N-acetyltransferase [Croceibacterium soli]